MGFRHGQHPMSTVAVAQCDPDTPARHNGYDEVAARRVEVALVDLGGKLGEAKAKLPWLDGVLDESRCSALLLRIRQNLEEAENDMSRLMCEAKRQIRGSDD